MALPLRLSTASQEVCFGPFVDTADGKTAKTALTIANTDVILWKEGATSTVTKNSGGGTHMTGGLYSLVFDATDSNTLGKMVAIVNVAGAFPVRHEFVVIPAVEYDASILGTDLYDVSVTQWLGNGVSSATNGVPDTNAIRLGNTVQTGRDVGASVLLSAGTGTGQLDFTGGVVKSSLVQILGSAISGTAAQIAAAFTKFFDKAAPTGTVNSLPDVVAGSAGGLFIAGTNAATTITTGLTTTLSGNVTGSVGSVTGNIGGNVVGTVGTVNALAANSLTAAAAASDLSTEIASAVMSSVIEGTITLLQAQRLQLAPLVGKVSGAATTTVTIRDTTDTKNRVVATVDSDGNRSAVTLDVS